MQTLLQRLFVLHKIDQFPQNMILDKANILYIVCYPSRITIGKR